MAEGVAALSLAANILQFIDFASKVLATSYNLRHSSDGGGSDNTQDLKIITTSLQRLVNNFEISQQVANNALNLSQTQKDLLDLTKNCNDIAEELLHAVNKLGSNGKTGRWSTFYIALKSVWAEGKVEGIRQRLGIYRQQIVLHILACFRDEFSGSMGQHAAILSDVNLKTEGIGQNFLTYIQESKRWQEEYLEDCERWKKEILNAIHQEGRRAVELNVVNDHARQNELLARLIRQLSFPEMEDRHNRISKAHEATFKWLLHRNTSASVQTRSWDNFIGWLESDISLYWVTGKAGSGKSTLMNYVHQDPRVLESLSTWASGATLVTAAFFFWNSGISIQMSYQGLLTSILHQILSQHPELARRILPGRWEAHYLFGDDQHPLTDGELRQAFTLLKKEDALRYIFCLFIDGLDEFDGKHSDLVDFVKNMTDSSHIKVCVSSRPWIVFEDSFKRKPSLKLQDLTRSDILSYITSMFSGNPGFAELQIREPEYSTTLLEDITQKSAGVFLWVNLVVHSLLAGFVNGDRISDLQRRLSHLPPDLENLYQKILDSLDPFYLEHASHLFHLVRIAKTPPSIFTMSFADEELDVILRRKIRPLDPEEVSRRVDIIKRRLNSRCKGLLEVGTVSMYYSTPSAASVTGARDFNSTVQYLHKTVKDFLEAPKVWNWLLSSRTHPYDPCLSLSKAMLGTIRNNVGEGTYQIASLWRFADGATYQSLISKCLFYAMEVQSYSNQDIV